MVFKTITHFSTLTPPPESGQGQDCFRQRIYALWTLPLATFSPGKPATTLWEVPTRWRGYMQALWCALLNPSGSPISLHGIPAPRSDMRVKETSKHSKFQLFESLPAIWGPRPPGIETIYSLSCLSEYLLPESMSIRKWLSLNATKFGVGWSQP